MKKDERLIQEMIYINSKKNFNLNDLIEEFDISRSTALRDIASLEELGVPLYSEKGSHGGYHVLENQLLPPIYFSNNELYSIFFSLQLLKTLLKTPFDKDYKEIKEKLLAVLPKKQKEMVQEADQVIQFIGTNQKKESPFLGELFSAILNKKVIEISYCRYGNNQRIIQPLRLLITDGNWYCFSWDLDKKEFRNFRCDYIQSVKYKDKESIPFTEEKISSLYRKQFNTQRPFSFKVKVSEKGVEQFYKRIYDNMSLQEEEQNKYIIGTFGEKEIDFLVQYFLSFGKEIKIISPEILRSKYKEYLKDILADCYEIKSRLHTN
ncbi:helix-turn-helix transcriptional regulator [Bacillus bingmayongensis]|uniref:helix-turn-helix transcriptional regulator n=1 Tax=Bacillus bingmayongensis TaxID=1150157 RepID=UPI00031BB0C7|nr:YafY family protein [Bacillus bingmayongensis]MBY0598040.1 YafY family transcriptional regulator [Bacillus bingmayongensis]